MAGVFATKRISLAFMGEGKEPNPWKDCYIDFRRYSLSDVDELDKMKVTKKVKVEEKDDNGEPVLKDGKPVMVEQEVSITNRDAMRNMSGFLKKRFVAGKVLDEHGEKVDLTADQLDEHFPLDIYNQALNELRVKLGPNG